MSKLIYVDRLKKDILALRDCYNGFSDTYDKACIIGVIDEQPTIEPKKGKWVDEPVYKQTMDGKTWDGYTYCSECREMHEYGYRSNFCPNCGCPMKGETDERN